MKTLEEMDTDEQRAFLKKHRKPFGARALIGKKYVDPKALPALGSAIEKRAKKALKRLAEQERNRQRAAERAAKKVGSRYV